MTLPVLSVSSRTLNCKEDPSLYAKTVSREVDAAVEINVEVETNVEETGVEDTKAEEQEELKQQEEGGAQMDVNCLSETSLTTPLGRS